MGRLPQGGRPLLCYAYRENIFVDIRIYFVYTNGNDISIIYAYKSDQIKMLKDVKRKPEENKKRKYQGKQYE